MVRTSEKATTKEKHKLWKLVAVPYKSHGRTFEYTPTPDQQLGSLGKGVAAVLAFLIDLRIWHLDQQDERSPRPGAFAPRHQYARNLEKAAGISDADPSRNETFMLGWFARGNDPNSNDDITTTSCALIQLNKEMWVPKFLTSALSIGDIRIQVESEQSTGRKGPDVSTDRVTLDAIYSWLVEQVGWEPWSAPETTSEPTLLAGDSHVITAVNQIAVKYASDVRSQWDALLRGEVRPEFEEDHRLDVYVEPRVGIRHELDSNHESSLEVDDPIRHSEIAGGLREMLDRYLLNPQDPRWVVIDQDAGSGKSVATWRIKRLLSDDVPEPYVALRFENGWPDDICGRCASELAKYCGDDATPTDVVRELLRQSRLVLILDALDQETRTSESRLFEQLRGSAELQQGLRVIMTGRTNAIQNRSMTDLRSVRWQPVQLLLFNKKQWSSYKQRVLKLLPPSKQIFWDRLVPDEEHFAELLAYPEVLKLIRNEIDNADSSEAIRPLQNRGDLYWRSFRHLFRRAFRVRGGLELHEGEDIDAGVDEMMAAASCIGFEMMLRYRNENGLRIPVGRAATLRRLSGQRFGDVAGWERAERRIRQTMNIRNSSIEYDEEIQIRSYKKLEFLAGMYLSCHAGESIQQETHRHVGDPNWYWPSRFAIEMLPERRDDSAWLRSLETLFLPISDELELGKQLRPTELMYRADQALQGHPARIAILDRYRSQYRRLLIQHGLDGSPAPDARLAATLVYQEDLPQLIRQAVAERREAVVPRLNELAGKQHLVIREATELASLRADLEFLDSVTTQNWIKLLLPHDGSGVSQKWTYQHCPPIRKGQTARHVQDCTFWMGTSDERDNLNQALEGSQADENPRHRVHIEPIVMQATTVTRAQYRLFDPNLEQSALSSERTYESIASLMQQYSPPQTTDHEDCPITFVSWWDSRMFSMWLGPGYRLPTEAEWEFACRAGTSGDYSFNGGADQLGSYAWWGGLSDNGNCQNERYAHPVATRIHNPWNLSDMHGNVWEWCQDAYDRDAYLLRIIEQLLKREELQLNDLEGFRGQTDLDRTLLYRQLAQYIAKSDFNALANCEGTLRVLRGGSWGSSADCCRSAHRRRDSPKNRSNNTGFRLCRD